MKEQLIDNNQALFSDGVSSDSALLSAREQKETKLDSPWIVDLRLDKRDLKGPLLLVISQPLRYKIIKDEPGLIVCPPITKDELAAIVEKIPKETFLTIVFGDGQNSYRYGAINSITTKPQKDKECQENKEDTLIRELTVSDGKKWLAENDCLIQKWKREGRHITVHLASDIMFEKDCQLLYERMWKDHKNKQTDGEHRKLQENFNKLASAAVKILYSDLLRNSSAGTKFYLSQSNENLSTQKLEELLINSTLCYIIHELALTVQLAKSTQAIKLLYKERIKKNQKKNGDYAQQVNFGEFAPQLIYFSLKLYSDLTQTPKMLYKEFFSSNQPAPPPIVRKEKSVETNVINEQIKLAGQYVSEKYSTQVNVFFMEKPKTELSDRQIPSASNSLQSIARLPILRTASRDSDEGSSPMSYSSSGSLDEESSQRRSSSESDLSSSGDSRELKYEDHKLEETVELSRYEYELLYKMAISPYGCDRREEYISNLECKETPNGSPSVKLPRAAYDVLHSIAHSPAPLENRKHCLNILKKDKGLPYVIESNVRTVVEESKKNLTNPPSRGSKAKSLLIPCSKNSDRFFKSPSHSSSSLPQEPRSKSASPPGISAPDFIGRRKNRVLAIVLKKILL